MNNKEIEEMAKVIKSVKLYGNDNYERIISYDSILELAKELLKYYQPKLSENTVVLTEEELKKIIQEEYQNALKGKVVLTREEYNALIAEYKTITYKYDDICDKYRLCKDANETIKQHAVMTRKETAKEILDKVSRHYGGAWLVELYKEYGLEVK